LPREPSRLGPIAFSATLPWVSALVLLPGEFSHYRRWLELGADETALRIAVLSAIVSKTFVALLAIFALLALGSRFVSPRTLRIASLATSFFLLGFLGLDLELQTKTGNNIADYLPFLLDPETFRWAGQGFDAASSVLQVVGKLLLALLLAGLAGWAFERWTLRTSRRVGHVALSGLLAVTFLPLVATPFLIETAGAPGPLYHLNERMPWVWSAASGSGSTEMESSQLRAQEIYSRMFPKLAEPTNLAGLLTDRKPLRTPDIVVVVVESLRHDALHRETMPRLWAFSQRGARFDRHFATSNASHYGMFALLYGRSPLTYFATLESQEPPTLPTYLRTAGYSTHYVSCTNLAWRDMDRFMGAPHFVVERMGDSQFEICDQRVTSRVAALLEPGGRAPRFVLAFLMSTHFGYHYPDGVEPFRPSLPPPNALDLQAERDREALSNRYRNSAHHIDSLLGQMLDGIDLENTVVVITGDHGESLFDDGTIAHSSLLSEIQTRVPLVLSGPGIPEASTRSSPTDHSDLLPTLLARLGVGPESLENLPGRDLMREGARLGEDFVPLVHAKARRGGHDRLALVSRRYAYSIRLDPTTGALRFLGKLRADGRPSRQPMTREDGDRAIRWFDRYLDDLVIR